MRGIVFDLHEIPFRYLRINPVPIVEALSFDFASLRSGQALRSSR
jgi:hypothetical protein